ncbi:MAG: hypothetical protein IT236_14400 [Bacteroidia bacterium]|nr:hypothetical protein [Bacteroidia bacterium]
MNIRIFIIISILAFWQFSCGPVGDEYSYSVSPDSSSSINNSSIVADTMEIWDSLASNPFMFKKWEVSLDSVLVHLPSNFQLEKRTEPSPYYEGASDSVTIIKTGASEIHHVKNPGISYIDQALIMDKEIPLLRNIRIGDSYKDVRSKLKEVKQTEKPFRKIYINYGDATSTLIFEFKEEKLYKVIYWPYTG